MTDAIGGMRARVTLESPARTGDEIGGAALTWVGEGDVWAAIASGVASQGADYDGAPSVGAYAVTINRREDVRAGWRVVWGERTLRIVGVRDDGATRIQLVCEEERL